MNASSKSLGLSKFSRISWLSQSGFLSGYVRLRVSFLFEGVSESQNTLNSRSCNLKSQNVSGSQRKTLVLPSHKVLHNFTIRHPYNRPTNNNLLYVAFKYGISPFVFDLRRHIHTSVCRHVLFSIY